MLLVSRASKHLHPDRVADCDLIAEEGVHTVADRAVGITEEPHLGRRVDQDHPALLERIASRSPSQSPAATVPWDWGDGQTHLRSCVRWEGRVNMASVPEDVYSELEEEFGAEAPHVAERALRSEITRHRISVAIKQGVDPATAVAEALARDPAFLADTDTITAAANEPSDLEERLRRWA